MTRLSELARMHNDLADVYEKHKAYELARHHRTIATQYAVIAAATAAAEASLAEFDPPTP